jgi:hypothetical protein
MLAAATNSRCGGRIWWDWSHEVFTKKLGCGGSTSFWLDRWVGIAPLCDSFPRLFNISLQRDHAIKDMGSGDSRKNKDF